MGITGLLPFLERASKRTNINEFSGSTVAIDSYCWLHKGVFPCAEKLIMGQQTDAYVHYCMKFINMLLSHKIKPILVFDGRHLPAKAQTEAKRREARKVNRHKAIELIRMGQHLEARNLMKRSIDVTHEMALELIKQCHKMNIDCIVAPYEADAQLAYLNINGIADVVITEDSDLTLFGCKKVFFKMNIDGNGILVDQEKLYLAMGTRFDHFSMDNFLYMCILSGCDYLASLPGIGLNKAQKFIKRNTDCDIYRALTRLGSYLNMKSLVVTQEYRDAFILAVITFKHQLVFCPLKRTQVRLNPPTPDVTEKQLYYAGTEIDPDIALQLALGNCDPFTLKVLHNFDPDKVKNQINKCNTWGQKAGLPRHISIWSKEYKLVQNQLQESPRKMNLMTWFSTASKKAVNNHKNHSKRTSLMKQDNSECEQLNQKEFLDIYGSKNIMDVENNSEVNISTPEEDKTSPILIKRNPFLRQSSSTKTSPSLLFNNKSRMKGRNMSRIRRTIINEEIVTESKFFANTTVETNNTIINDNNNVNSNEILSEKGHMQLGKANERNNTDLQELMVTDKVEMDSHPMDVDEEHNASFVSNECKDVKHLNSFFNCDLGKSNLDVTMNDSFTEENSNANELRSLNTLLTSSEFDTDSDFIIPKGDINTLNNSFFKWPAIKAPVQTCVKKKQNRNKILSNSRTNVNIKVNMTNSTRRNQQSCLMQGQQSLNMFGFEKKKVTQNTL